jgi:hypothetical protein
MLGRYLPERISCYRCSSSKMLTWWIKTSWPGWWLHIIASFICELTVWPTSHAHNTDRSDQQLLEDVRINMQHSLVSSCFMEEHVVPVTMQLTNSDSIHPATTSTRQPDRQKLCLYVLQKDQPFTSAWQHLYGYLSAYNNHHNSLVGIFSCPLSENMFEFWVQQLFDNYIIILLNLHIL